MGVVLWVFYCCAVVGKQWMVVMWLWMFFQYVAFKGGGGQVWKDVVTQRVKRKAGLSNWFTLSVCLSVCLSTDVSLWSRNYLISIGTWIGTRTSTLAVLSLWIWQIVRNLVPMSHAQREGNCFYSVCLSGSPTKLKIIPNRKLTGFRNIIKNTNHRREELM